MDSERVDFHLWNWSRWQFDARDELARGYPTRCGVIGRCHGSDFDTMVAACDTRCAMATDAVVDALPAPERAAVHARHLGARWRFPDPLGKVYAQACVSVGRGLQRRGVV